MTLKFNEDGYPYEDLIEENKKLESKIKELDNSLSMDEVAYRELQAENEKLKSRAQEAEGETSIVKAVGANSPEMKALQKENEELKSNLARAKEDHQFDNLVYKKEIESLGKK